MTNIIYTFKKSPKNGEIIGCVVAKKIEGSLHFGVGWSKVCKRDKFDKALGLKIAQGRAEKGSIVNVPDCLSLDLEIMTSRAMRYFKGHSPLPLKQKMAEKIVGSTP